MRGLVFVCTILIAPTINAISFIEAERLAIESDPELQGLMAEVSALSHLAVAEAQLPDPRLQLAAQPVPLPSFDVRDEPMSQFQLGIEQRVPPRSQREARVRAVERRADALRSAMSARQLVLRSELRLHGASIARLGELLALTQDRAALLGRYSESLENGVENGRVSQQTLLEGRTRALRVQRTLVGLRARLAEHRAALGALLPGQALPEQLTAWTVPSGPVIELGEHPEMRAARLRAELAEARVDLAQAAFDPGWSWSVGVGRRIGATPLGAPDDTLLNARLSIDLPLFTDRRQSQRLSAARALHRAALSGPLQVERELGARLQRAQGQAREYESLVLIYADDVLPPALATVAAARDKYRNGVIPLEDVLAAEIEVLDVRHEQIEARLDLDLLRIELAYLGGQ